MVDLYVFICMYVFLFPFFATTRLVNKDLYITASLYRVGQENRTILKSV